MTRLITILLIFTIACNSSPTRTRTDTTHIDKDTTASDNSEDTLRLRTHYSYLSDLPLRQVAHLILTDSISPLDNQITFDCMDSLSADNANTREFYFPVFNKIVSKSGGALSEVVGQYIMKYVERFPKEFADKSKSLKEDEFKSWSSYVAYELHFAYDTPKKTEGWMAKIISNCKECNNDQINRLQGFNKLSISSMKELADD
jgi:hypothetical protein